MEKKKLESWKEDPLGGKRKGVTGLSVKPGRLCWVDRAVHTVSDKVTDVCTQFLLTDNAKCDFYLFFLWKKRRNCHVGSWQRHSHVLPFFPLFSHENFNLNSNWDKYSHSIVTYYNGTKAIYSSPSVFICFFQIKFTNFSVKLWLQFFIRSIRKNIFMWNLIRSSQYILSTYLTF